MHPGFIPRNHPNATKKRGVDDSIDDRETPPCIFVPLHAEFDFTLDVAASNQNRKCTRFCSLDGGPTIHVHGERVGAIDLGNGLTVSWAKERVWCNPPFSRVRPWVERAWSEPAEVVALLLPNNRGEQPFWQDLIEPYRDKPGSILTTRNLRKRRPFLHHGQGIGNRTSKNPPFGLTLVVWDRRPPEPLRVAA